MPGIPQTPGERARLRDLLLSRYPWLSDPETGPQSVSAGECDRCGNEARLVGTCGPGSWSAIGRRCAHDLGVTAWCEGHVDDARRHLAALASLPPEADIVARWWWVATGEVRPAAGAPGVPAPLPDI